MLPTTRIGTLEVTRLICGGNPFSGTSHQTEALDWEMTRYYTMPRLQAVLDRCWAQGINTVQSRGDRHQMRMILEHRERGGRLQWIAQTASEHASIEANIDLIARFGAVAIYHHGTHTDNLWHAGEIDRVRDYVKRIKDRGLLAGVGTHIPAVIEYAEAQGWETDFYMGCLYNLARGYKSAPAVDRDAYARDRFSADDPPRMMAALRAVAKPCIAFKLLAAGRRCATPADTRAAFAETFAGIKPIDMVDVGMFPRDRDQIAENAGYVRELLGAEEQ